MSTHFKVLAAFVGLGAYVFLIYRSWYRYLAARHDSPERRKQALQRIFVPMLLTAISLGITLDYVIRALPNNLLFILGAFLCSVAPTVIWWLRSLPALRALGYGRQTEDQSIRP